MFKEHLKSWPLLVGLSLLLLLFSLPIDAMAASDTLPIFKSEDGQTKETTTMNQTVSNITNDLNSKAPMISLTISTLFSIMFLIGVIRMAYALVTKTGMVLKGSTGILIGVPIFVLTIRLFFIISFTTTESEIPHLVTDVMNLLIKAGFYSAIGMLLVALLMKLFHKFLNHPEYGRWSKRLFIGASSLVILTAIMPVVLTAI